MTTSYPTALDVLTNPTPTSYQDEVEHDEQHANANDAVEAVQAKLGIGASVSVQGNLLIGSGAGASAWGNTVVPLNAATTPLILKGAANQTADLLQLQDSNAFVRLRVRAKDQVGGFVHVTNASTNPPDTADYFAGFRAQMTAKGTSSLAIQSRTTGARFTVSDDAGVADKVVSGVANNGSGLIRITTSTPHGLATDDKIAVYGVGGVTNANGWFRATVIGASTVDLQGSTFAGAYTSGGTLTNRPMLNGITVQVGPLVDRGGLSGTTAENGDDVGGVTIHNVGLAKATTALYVANSTTVVGKAWDSGIDVDANATYAYHVGSRNFEYGLYLKHGTFSVAAIVVPNNASIASELTGGAVTNLIKLNADDKAQIDQGIRIPNDINITARNAANSADVALLKLNASNKVQMDTQIRIPNATAFQARNAAGSADVNIFQLNADNKIQIDTAIRLANAMIVYGRNAAGAADVAMFQLNADDKLQIGPSIRIPNATNFYGRNVGDNADVALFQIDTTNRFAIQTTTIIADGFNIQVGTGTGTKLGSTASQKIGFWGATAIVQPTTGVTAATIVGGAGTTVKEDHTFDGYTIAKVVKALRNAGLLA